MEVTVYLDDIDDSVNRVVISQPTPVIGKVTPSALLTIYDNDECECTFLYSQASDLINALIDAREQWDSKRK